MSEIKIFAINDCEWWAGIDLESVKAAFIAEGYGDESSFCDPYEVAAPDMQRLKYIDGPSDGNGPESTFQEHLNLMIAGGARFPCFFATTEF